MSVPDQFARLFEQTPTAFLVKVLRGFDERGMLDEFRAWLDQETFDPTRPGGRGRYSEHLLLACDEALEYGSDPGEVLRALITGDQLAFSGVSADVRLRDRVAALRPARPNEDQT
jgi:hypothetical protein